VKVVIRRKLSGLEASPVPASRRKRALLEENKRLPHSASLVRAYREVAVSESFHEIDNQVFFVIG
jgi:hypothetical protein